MPCVGWYWTVLEPEGAYLSALWRGGLMLRCDCTAEYDLAYIFEHDVVGARCGSCYVKMFKLSEEAALRKLGVPSGWDHEHQAEPIEGLLQLLGYHRVAITRAVRWPRKHGAGR